MSSIELIQKSLLVQTSINQPVEIIRQPVMPAGPAFEIKILNNSY